MKIVKKINQTGDTIIEVLMVLAILSMSFGISYATANKGLNQSLNGEEHSVAVGILDTQIEELRIAINTHPAGFPPAPGQYFCMTSNSTFKNISTIPQSSTADSQGAWSEYGSSCTFSTFYHASISIADPTNSKTYTYKTPVPTYCTPGVQSSCSEYSFTFMVRWDGTGDLGPQQESLTYRFGTGILSAGNYQNSETYVPPSPILVILREIGLRGSPGTTSDPTPHCSDPVTGGANGATITLTGPGYNSSGYTSAGSVAFNNLTDNDTYTATVTGLPAGYQLCQYGSPASLPRTVGSATPTQSTSPNPITIDSNSVGLSARPICSPQTIQTGGGYWQWVDNWQYVIVGYSVTYAPVYGYYWGYYDTWYTSSNTTLIGKYAKVSNTPASAATYQWIGWTDPYNVGYKDWAWPMYQVDSYISGYVITGYPPIYGWVNYGYWQWVPPVYSTIYNCPP